MKIIDSIFEIFIFIVILEIAEKVGVDTWAVFILTVKIILSILVFLVSPILIGLYFLSKK